MTSERESELELMNIHYGRQIDIGAINHNSTAFDEVPCIRLARGKFELTNQNSAGEKKSSVLTSRKQVRKGFEIRQLFSLEMTLNINEKGFTFSKTIPVCKKWKI